MNIHRLAGVFCLTLLTHPLGALAAPSTPAPEPAGTARGIVAEARVTAEPGYDIHVGADFSGILAHVDVKEGDKVHAGDKLAEFDASVQRAALAAAQARVKEAEANIHLAALRVRRGETLLRQHALPQEGLDERRRDLDVARAQLHTAQAEAQRLRAEIAHSIVTAPIAGTVLSRRVDAGESVDRGQVLFQLADLTHLRLTADVDEFDASQVRVGAPVRITAEGYPGRHWAGTVTEVPALVSARQLQPLDPAAPTDVGVVRVKVSLPAQHPFRLGRRVEVRILPSP